jgi:excisionase family DNA binding protein
MGSAEAALALHVSTWTVRRWVREGRLRSVRPGHRRLVSREDVERLLAMPAPEQTATPTKESGSGET